MADSLDRDAENWVSSDSKGGDSLDRDAASYKTQAAPKPTRPEVPPEAWGLHVGMQADFPKASPQTSAEAIGALGTGVRGVTDISRAAATDVVTGLTDLITQPAYGYSPQPNLPAVGRKYFSEPGKVTDEELPVDVANRELAPSHPILATSSKIAQGVAGTAPMLAIGALPSIAQKAILAGFTAQMMKDAPETAKQLGDEMGKPREQWDWDKITSLVSQFIQDTGFSVAGSVALKRAIFKAKSPSKSAITPETEAVAAKVLPQSLQAAQNVIREQKGEPIVETKQPIEQSYASTIPSNKKGRTQKGKVAQGSENISGENLQFTSSIPPEPVGAREEAQEQVEAKPAPEPPAPVAEPKPTAKDLTYDWKTLDKQGKLFESDNKTLTPIGRISYLKGVIEKNPIDIKEIDAIYGDKPLSTKAYQGLPKEDWQKALSVADKVWITDITKKRPALGGGSIEHTVFEGKIKDYPDLVKPTEVKQAGVKPSVDLLNIERTRGRWRATWNEKSPVSGVFFHEIKSSEFPTIESAKSEFQNQIDLAAQARAKMIKDQESAYQALKLNKQQPKPTPVESPTKPVDARESGEPKPTAKEPWEMTQLEYSGTHKRGQGAEHYIQYMQAIGRHAKSVQLALSEGKPVPAEVLADYPDLVKSPEVKQAVGKVEQPTMETKLKEAGNKADIESIKNQGGFEKFIAEREARIVKAEKTGGQEDYIIAQRKQIARALELSKQAKPPEVKQAAGKAPTDAELLVNAPKEVMVNPHDSAMKRDAQLRKQQAWLKEQRRQLGLVKERKPIRYADTLLPEHKQPKPTPVESPTVKNPLQLIETEPNLSIKLPKAASKIRITYKDATKKGAPTKVDVVDKSYLEDNPLANAGIKVLKVEAGTIGKDKKFIPSKENLGVGLGAARLGETRGGQATPNVLAAAHEQIRAERVKANLAPVPKQLSKADPVQWNKAMEQLDKDPEAAQKLAQELKASGASTIDDTQTYMLLHEHVSLRNALNNISDYVFNLREQAGVQKWTAKEVSEHLDPLEAQKSEIGRQLDDIDWALEHTGSELGRGLRARRIVADDDMSYAGITSQLKKSLGRTLTKLEETTAQKIAKRIEVASADKETSIKHYADQMDLGLKDINVEPPKSSEAARLLFSKYKAGAKMTLQQTKTIWLYAKKFYLERGESDFGNIRYGVAKDLGIEPNDVTRALAAPKSVRAASVDMYKKAAQARRIIDTAKWWVNQQKYPKLMQWLMKYPRLRFSMAIFGHAFVPFGTHAPIEFFKPWTYPRLVSDYFKMARMTFDAGYHERMMQDLEHSPRYWFWRQAGAQIDVTRPMEEYAEPGLITHLRTGTRAFDILKILRYQKNEVAWNKLPAHMKTKDMGQFIAAMSNHATGVVKQFPVQGKLGRFFQIAMFAPRLIASRFAWTIGDPIKATGISIRKGLGGGKNVTPEEMTFAKKVFAERAAVAAVYVSYLALNQAYLSATKSKQKVNMFDTSHADWLAFKVGGYEVRPWSPEITMLRDTINILRIGIMPESKFKQLQGGRGESFVGTAGQFARGTLSPAAQDIPDFYTRKTIMGEHLPFNKESISAKETAYGTKKLTWPEYSVQKLMPIPAEQASIPAYHIIRDAFSQHGVSKADTDAFIRSLGTLIPMAMTGIRVQEDKTINKPTSTTSSSNPNRPVTGSRPN